jgi:hypothetical protein
MQKIKACGGHSKTVAKIFCFPLIFWKSVQSLTILAIPYIEILVKSFIIPVILG